MDRFSITKHEFWKFTPEGPVFVHTVVLAVGTLKVKRIAIPEREHAIDSAVDDLTLVTSIPVEHIWPEPVNEMRRYTGQSSADVYLKEPNLGNYDMLKDTM